MITELEETKTIETKTAHISLIDDKIVRLAIKDKAQLEYESLKENYEAYREMLNGNKAPFLIIVNDTAEISTAGREEYNKKVNEQIRMADALIIKSPATMLLINSQVNFIKPKVPIQAFMNEHEGIAWLKDFIE